METIVLSVNKSEYNGAKEKHTTVEIRKTGIPTDFNYGIQKSVSLLDLTHIKNFEKICGLPNITFGAFSENLTVKGLDSIRIDVLDRFENESVGLEVTSVGYKFSGFYRNMADYLLQREGIFCRVINEGTIKNGDILFYTPKIYRVKIITVSDRASLGVYQDLSGAKIRELTQTWFDSKRKLFSVAVVIIPDDAQKLTYEIKRAIDEEVDIVFTCGGTGISPRDVTVDVVCPLLDKELSGVMEMIRWRSGLRNPNSLLSRSVAGVAKRTLIYTLPGSLNAVNEYLSELFLTLEHTILMLNQIDAH